MIDGVGDPSTARAFQDAVQASYSISYTLKFVIKKGDVTDYGVMLWEGLWWTKDMTQFSMADKES